MAYTYTFTVTDDSPQALNFVKFIKSLDFIHTVFFCLKIKERDNKC